MNKLMKATEAPEKIYISTNSQDGTYYISNQYKRLIEYTRTDAFIEKATSYLNSKLYDWVQISHFGRREYPDTIMKRDFIYDLKQAMKDE